MKRARLSFAARTIFPFFVSWFLIVFANGPFLTARPTSPPQARYAAVTEALQAAFGSAVEAVTRFEPFYLTGDFNWDGMQDIVAVVRIKEKRTALPK